MRQVHVSCRGDVYIFGSAGETIDGFESVSSSEAACILRELERSRQYSVLQSILETFGYLRPSSPLRSGVIEPLIAELQEAGVWRYGGMCWFELFRRSRMRVSLSFNTVDSADELADLADVEVLDEEHWIEVDIRDVGGEPVVGLNIEIELPNGFLRTGRTNLFGFVRADGIYTAGLCKVRIPELDEFDIPEPPAEQRSWIGIEIMDEEGPCPDLELSVILPDGTTQTIKTDAHGSLRLDNIPGGLCTISPTAAESPP